MVRRIECQRAWASEGVCHEPLWQAGSFYKWWASKYTLICYDPCLQDSKKAPLIFGTPPALSMRLYGIPTLPAVVALQTSFRIVVTFVGKGPRWTVTNLMLETFELTPCGAEGIGRRRIYNSTISCPFIWDNARFSVIAIRMLANVPEQI